MEFDLLMDSQVLAPGWCSPSRNALHRLGIAKLHFDDLACFIRLVIAQILR